MSWHWVCRRSGSKSVHDLASRLFRAVHRVYPRHCTEAVLVLAHNLSTSWHRVSLRPGFGSVYFLASLSMSLHRVCPRPGTESVRVQTSSLFRAWHRVYPRRSIEVVLAPSLSASWHRKYQVFPRSGIESVHVLAASLSALKSAS